MTISELFEVHDRLLFQLKGIPLNSNDFSSKVIEYCLQLRKINLLIVELHRSQCSSTSSILYPYIDIKVVNLCTCFNFISMKPYKAYSKVLHINTKLNPFLCRLRLNSKLACKTIPLYLKMTYEEESLCVLLYQYLYTLYQQSKLQNQTSTSNINESSVEIISSLIQYSHYESTKMLSHWFLLWKYKIYMLHIYRKLVRKTTRRTQQQVRLFILLYSGCTLLDYIVYYNTNIIIYVEF
jgi:hypothetical protein